ncbi:DUF4861 domain-containing protein [Mariniflexile jejuense]|uniref:DUF4861 domain-containing protein n=1 Tax=Mariniflexile jejuense TaxID=1173582 RepID=A0ABW3JIH3_9FLAO
MNKKIKLGTLLGLVVLQLMACKTQKQDTIISLTNASDILLTDKPVVIKRNQFSNTISSSQFPLLLIGTDTIPSQMNDIDADGNWDELFFVINFSANETKNIQLKWIDTKPSYEVKTSVRFGKRSSKNTPVQPATDELLLANEVHKALGYQPYQTDGPTWENDKVGFRHYLDGRNAKDVFAKKTAAITPENVGIDSVGGVEDNYHVMHDWGRDVFPVGNSVGLGGFAMLINDKVERLGITTNDTLNNIEKTTFKVTAEGSVNSILSYEYQNWEVSGNKYQAQETTSIWPGMYGYKNTVSLSGLKGNETLLIGLSNINNEKGLNTVNVGDWVCLIQHDKLTYERQWVMGTALIIPKTSFKGVMEAPKEGQLTNSYLAKFKVENNKPISYYAIAACELSEDKNFIDSEYFTNYVVNLAKQLATEINIEIKN